MRIDFSTRRASLSGLEGNSCASIMGSLKRSPSLLARSVSICDRIILTGCGPSGTVFGSWVVSSTFAGPAAGTGSGALVVLDDVSNDTREGGRIHTLVQQPMVW